MLTPPDRKSFCMPIPWQRLVPNKLEINKVIVIIPSIGIHTNSITLIIITFDSVKMNLSRMSYWKDSINEIESPNRLEPVQQVLA